MTNDDGQQIAPWPQRRDAHPRRRQGPRAREVRRSQRAEVLRQDGQEVRPGSVLCKWDPHIIPILAEVGGTSASRTSSEGETLRKEKDAASGIERRSIMEHKGDLHPQITIEDDRGQDPRLLLHPRAGASRSEGQKVTAGHAAGQDAARRCRGTQDITGGLPRVTEDLRGPQAARPGGHGRDRRQGRARRQAARQADHHHPAVDETASHRRGEASTWCRTASDLRVHAGDYVKAGDPLVRPAGAARHPAHHRRRGGAAVPGPRGAEGLPQSSAWRSTTSTSRSSSPRCSAR